jgi:hypothetical protein
MLALSVVAAFDIFKDVPLCAAYAAMPPAQSDGLFPETPYAFFFKFRQTYDVN